MATTRLHYTYSVISRAGNFGWQRKWKTSTSKVQYITSNPVLKSVKVPSIYLNNTSSNSVGFTLRIQDWLTAIKCQLTCSNTECKNQRFTIKHCLEACPQWRDIRRKYNIHGNIEELLGKNCKVGKLMKFNDI